MTATRNMIEMLAADSDCHGDITMRLEEPTARLSSPMAATTSSIAPSARSTIPSRSTKPPKFIPGVVENGCFSASRTQPIGGPEGVSVIEAHYNESHEAV